MNAFDNRQFEPYLPMNVTIAVQGRFHAFNLAHQLSKRGYLRRLITTYSAFAAEQYGVPRFQICSFPILEVLKRAWRKSPFRFQSVFNPDIPLSNLFDLWASRRIPGDTRLFVGWSSAALASIRRAHELGAVTVLDSGSSHAQYQKKILAEEHGRYGMNFSPTFVEKKLREYEEASYIAVPSRFAWNTFLEYGISEKKLLYIPYGVDVQEFKPIPKQDSVFRVLYCGVLLLRKGVHYLLQAFSELRLPASELWLIGEMTEEMKPFFQKYRNDRVFHKGPYPQNKLYQHYSQGSVFCLPSIEDGMGMVIPQAMACGLPVIATTHTGGPDIIEERKHGFLVPPRDVTSLKEKILFFFENPGLGETMGQAAMAHIKACHTWDHYGERVAACYRKILANRPIVKG